MNHEPRSPEALTLELDCRGLRCPLPVITLAKQFAALSVGELAGVATEDPAAATDIPAWCRMRGQDYVEARSAADGVPIYVVRRVS